MASRSLHLGLFLFLALLAFLALAILAMASEVAVQRTPQTETHMLIRHGTTALGALLAVRACPSPIVFNCPSDAERYRIDAYVVACPLDGGSTCAVCVVDLRGILRTCYIRHSCSIEGCLRVPEPPKFVFPSVCPDPAHGCVSESDLTGGITIITPKEVNSACEYLSTNPSTP